MRCNIRTCLLASVAPDVVGIDVAVQLAPRGVIDAHTCERVWKDVNEAVELLGDHLGRKIRGQGVVLIYRKLIMQSIHTEDKNQSQVDSSC